MNRFSNTNEYLAVVNDDGLWIKEEIDQHLYIIHAKNLIEIRILLKDKHPSHGLIKKY